MRIRPPSKCSPCVKTWNASREPALPGLRRSRAAGEYSDFGKVSGDSADGEARQALGPRPRGPARERRAAPPTSSPRSWPAHGVDFSFAPVLDLDYGSCGGHRRPCAGTSIPTRWARSAPASCRGGIARPRHGGGRPSTFRVTALRRSIPMWRCPRIDRPVKDIFSKDVVPTARRSRRASLRSCPRM